MRPPKYQSGGGSPRRQVGQRPCGQPSNYIIPQIYKILQLLYDPNKKVVVNFIRKVNVGQFYGIECEEFPSQIAKVAMWLIDHQMNIELSNVFGEYVDDLPLSKYAKIVCDNALRYDWENLIEPQNLSYIVGNPPFVGARLMDSQSW